MTCCSLALGPRLTSQTLLPGRLLGQVRGFEQRVSRPGVEHGRQHHFILQRRARRPGHRFKGLQRVGNDTPANHDL